MLWTLELVPRPIKNLAMWYVLEDGFSSSNSNTMGCLKSPKLFGLKRADTMYDFPAGILITLNVLPTFVIPWLSERLNSLTVSRTTNRFSLTAVVPALVMIISVIFALSVNCISPKSISPCGLSKSQQTVIAFLSWMKDSLQGNNKLCERDLNAVLSYFW